MKKAAILAGLALAAMAASADAQQQPSYGPSVDVAAAKKIAAGALAECARNGWNVAVAVVDTHGVLVYLERMDDTQIAGVNLAILKASAAATYRRPTRAFEDAIQKGRVAAVTFPGMVASPGGNPIIRGGKVIGAVGVSGVAGDQDEQCAKAGLAAM
jgi:glc operon protein GlcG